MADREPDDHPLVQPTENPSSWTVNWSGFAAVVLIAVICLVAWRWLDGSSDHPDLAEAGRPPASTADSGTTQPTGGTTPRPAVSTTSAPLATTVPETTVTPDRQVLISGEMMPCRFGANCLVASFEIVGFDQHPGLFTCIYPNSRREFSFNDDDVIGACLSGDQGDTITIEVDGVRSATISEQNLDGI